MLIWNNIKLQVPLPCAWWGPVQWWVNNIVVIIPKLDTYCQHCIRLSNIISLFPICTVSHLMNIGCLSYCQLPTSSLTGQKQSVFNGYFASIGILMQTCTCLWVSCLEKQEPQYMYISCPYMYGHAYICVRARMARLPWLDYGGGHCVYHIG